jgi:hypothetical protein
MNYMNHSLITGMIIDRPLEIHLRHSKTTDESIISDDGQLIWDFRTYPLIRTERRKERGMSVEARGGSFQTEVKSKATKAGVSRTGFGDGIIDWHRHLLEPSLRSLSREREISKRG